MIQTVCGPIAPQQLGVCLPHEHLWCDTRRAARPHLFGLFGGPDLILRDKELMHRELRSFRQAGGEALVEVTTPGWGRDVTVLRDISEQTGVHIIATTGFYVDACLPPLVDSRSVIQLADGLLRELEQGVGSTGIRPGLLKVATSTSRIEGREEKALQAVARAQTRTGRAITTHTPNARNPEMAGGNMGEAFLSFFEAYGVHPHRLIIGHVDARPRPESLVKLGRAGCYLAFDLVGAPHRLHDESRALLIKTLIDEGLLHRLLLSHDVCQHSHTQAGGGRGFCHIFTHFLPRLRKWGISAGEIHTMMVDNVARVLTPG